MKNHNGSKVLSIVFFLVAAWLLFSWVALVYLFIVRGALAEGMPQFTGLLFAFGSVLLLGGGIAHAAAGYGLWRGKTWARTLSIVLASITTVMGLLVILNKTYLWGVLYVAFGLVVLLYSIFGLPKMTSKRRRS